MNTEAQIGKVVNRYNAILRLLRSKYPEAKGNSLHAVVKNLGTTLSVVLNRSIKEVVQVRNAAVHSEQFKIPTDFYCLCDEIEQLIPFFENQQHAKPDQPAKRPKATPRPLTKGALPK